MLIFTVWAISLLVSVVVGYRKGNPVGAAFIGLIFGPIGMVVVLLSSDKNRISCKFCAEKVFKEATICPHCRKELI